MKALQEFLDGFGFGISKEDLVLLAYYKLSADGHECYTINDRYINVDGQDFQIIKSRRNNGWLVRAF